MNTMVEQQIGYICAKALPNPCARCARTTTYQDAYGPACPRCGGTGAWQPVSRNRTRPDASPPSSITAGASTRRLAPTDTTERRDVFSPASEGVRLPAERPSGLERPGATERLGLKGAAVVSNG